MEPFDLAAGIGLGLGIPLLAVLIMAILYWTGHDSIRKPVHYVLRRLDL